MAQQVSTARAREPWAKEDEDESDVLASDAFVESVSLRGFYQRGGKRLLDIALGTVLFVVALPIIMLAALAVLLSSGAPVFYRADRLGRNGKQFSMWKLRTMVPDADAVLAQWQEENQRLAAEYAANFKLKDDPRITAVGRVLRRSSIDELPQLWNVLRGDMSLVGPRPYYEHELQGFPVMKRSVLTLRPGVTGPWQVMGRNSLAPSARMFLDRSYVHAYSLSKDIRYLAATVRTLVRANGV